MNETWARLIVHTLISRGVRRFCLSPGSRSSPLAYAIAEAEGAIAIVHPDERSSAFYAYGYSKGSGEVTAIVTTSGSAVGNLMPAIMEASHDEVPLIILTADRPPELRDCGSNQSCDQVKIFSPFVRWECDLPCPDPAIDPSYLASQIAYATFHAARAPRGPVHLNCMFRAPLFSNGVQHAPSPLATHYEEEVTTLRPESLERLAKKLASFERGVIIAGDGAFSPHLFTLAEKLHFPLFADLLSGLRSELQQSAAIPYYPALVEMLDHWRPDCVLHFGGRLISKSLSQWAAKAKPEFYLHVSETPVRHDPHHLVTDRVVCDTGHFAEMFLPLTMRKNSWLSEWQALSERLEGHIDRLVGEMSEPHLTRFLHHHVPSHYALFFANSMPVRDADSFFFPRFYRGPIFGKRGLSGIDGNIATAIGLAEGSQRPLLAILGDLTALCDLGSLMHLAKSAHPVIFLIVNNGGGGIFSLLPTPDKKETFETFMASSHTLRFAEAARLFNIPYQKLESFSTLARALREEKTCILELNTNREENAALHAHISKELAECLHSTSFTAS